MHALYHYFRALSEQWHTTKEDTPKTFLKAKDSLLVKDKDVVCQPKTFLRAKDSIRLRLRSGSVPIRWVLRRSMALHCRHLIAATNAEKSEDQSNLWRGA